MKKQIFIAILAVIPSLTFAASFDCSKAGSITEKTICNNPALSALDDKLAEAYKNAKAKTNDEATLKAQQIEWIKSSRTCNGDSNCLEKAYKERIAALSGSQQSAGSNQQMQPKSNPVTAPVSPRNPRETLVNNLGPSGWAKCMASYVTISALIARGDPGFPPQAKEMNDSLGEVLGGMRQYMLTHGVTQNSLDGLVKVSASQIRNGDEAVAANISCIKEVNRLLGN